jgi:hypothetical protein
MPLADGQIYAGYTILRDVKVVGHSTFTPHSRYQWRLFPWLTGEL